MTETEQQKFDEELHKTALTDLINRAVSGSFIYVIVWALIGYTYGLLKTHPTFYLFYTVLLFLLGVTRIIPKFLSKDFFNKHFKFIKITFEINVIAHSFLFGLLTTYVYHEPELKPLFLAMVLSAAAFIGAGTATLAINKVIRFMFPAAMLLPFLFYLVSHPTKESQLLGIISIVFAVYIILATKNIYNDYLKGNITREELYNLVWSKPVIYIAKVYGYSDSGIRKICKKHNIPLPKLGYWSKLKFNKEVVFEAEGARQPRLPALRTILVITEKANLAFS